MSTPLGPEISLAWRMLRELDLEELDTCMFDGVYKRPN